MASIAETSAEVVIQYSGTGTVVPKDVTKVVFDSTVTEIEEGAFRGCEQLKEVVLNEGLRKIRSMAFGYCSSLESIRLPSTVIEVGDMAFSGCSNLRDLVLNKGLRKIGRWTFDDCRSLESIRLPSTVTEVGDEAFCDCENLRDVVLNRGIQKIGRWTFHRCGSLEIIKLSCISRRLQALSHNDQTAIEIKINETP
ncbi:hypothetical protein ACHAXR_006723, partial [Thalassiosira sp. AJA248-18]